MAIVFNMQLARLLNCMARSSTETGPLASTRSRKDWDGPRLILIFFWTKSLKIYIPLFPTKVIYMPLARYACIFPPPPFYIYVVIFSLSLFLFSSLFPKIYPFSLPELPLKIHLTIFPISGGWGGLMH
jgi:hypothetical protein